jgi:Tol biopolymer transport system component
VRRSLAVTLVVLVSSACGSGEPEPRSEGTAACIADLAQAIGPEPELHGATWSPDGRRIAFSAWNGRKTGIYAVTVADCAVERLGPRANVNAGAADWSSANLLAFDGTAPGGTEEGIYTMDADGGHVRRVTDGPDSSPEWSPEGTRIAFVRGGFAEITDDDPSPAYANRNVWVANPDGSGLRQVTDGRWHGSADWSLDGQRLVSDSDFSVVEFGLDGGDRRVLLQGEYGDPSWSPDGEALVVAVGVGVSRAPEDWGLGLAEDGQPPVESLDTPIAFSSEWSPDGEWIAFRDGENEADVWVVRPDGTGLRQLTKVG